MGLFGRSGAGKTSVINAIAGIAKPGDAASIRINDAMPVRRCARNRSAGRKNGGSVTCFQEHCSFLTSTWNRTCSMGSGCARPPIASLNRDGSSTSWDWVALLRRKPGALSGGEKQRVAIGRALLAQPRILLMDEPLAALDVPRKTEILDYIERLRDELAIPIVYVTHSVPEIARLADTVVVLSEGKCIAAGDVEDVMGRLDLKPATSRTRQDRCSRLA